MDFIVKKIAAFGVPGLILTFIMAITGYKGAVALTVALKVLGGPMGMLGGIAMLGLIGLLARGFAKYGMEAICKAVLLEQYKTKTKDEIIQEIKKYPLTHTMKLKLIDFVEKCHSAIS